MRNLLKLEFRKLIRQKSFYICTGIMAALVFLAAVLSNVLLKLVPTEYLEEIGCSGIHSMISAAGNSSYTLIICIFASLFICDDYSQQTIKIIYARGYAKKSVYFAKLLSLWTAATVMYATVLLVGFLFGTVFFGVGEVGNFKFLALIGVQYIILLSCVSLYFTIASLFRKKGAAISICIVGPIVLNIMLSIADAFREAENFLLTDYWVETLLTDASDLTVSTKRLLICLAIAVIYMVVLLALGLFFNQKRD